MEINYIKKNDKNIDLTDKLKNLKKIYNDIRVNRDILKIMKILF